MHGGLSRSGRRRDRQSFPALGPATLQDEPTVLRAHAHQEAVSATATTTVRLERTLHDLGSPVTGKNLRRNPDPSEGRGSLSILASDPEGHLPTTRVGVFRRVYSELAALPHFSGCSKVARGLLYGAIVTREIGVLQSLPLRSRRVSPRSFPQLWKKMWKSQRFRPSTRPLASSARRFRRRRSNIGGNSLP